MDCPSSGEPGPGTRQVPKRHHRGEGDLPQPGHGRFSIRVTTQAEALLMKGGGAIHDRESMLPGTILAAGLVESQNEREPRPRPPL